MHSAHYQEFRDRRVHPRVRPIIPVMVEITGASTCEVAALRDISLGGMKVLTCNFSIGETVDCRIIIPGAHNEVLRANVVSASSGKCIGLELLGKHKISKVIDTLFDYGGLCAASLVYVEQGFVSELVPRFKSVVEAA